MKFRNNLTVGKIFTHDFFLKLAASVAMLVSASSFAVERVESTVIGSDLDNSVLGAWQLTPLAGLTYVDDRAAASAGARMGYRLLSDYPLYGEPSLLMSFHSAVSRFQFEAGLRYDVDVARSAVRPFARAAIGPTFQTSGNAAVFGASIGGGLFIPINENIDFRTELDMVSVNGNAGVQVLAGVSL